MACEASVDCAEHDGPIIAEDVGGRAHYFCLKCLGSVSPPAKNEICRLTTEKEFKEMFPDA